MCAMESEGGSAVLSVCASFLSLHEAPSNREIPGEGAGDLRQGLKHLPTESPLRRGQGARVRV